MFHHFPRCFQSTCISCWFDAILYAHTFILIICSFFGSTQNIFLLYAFVISYSDCDFVHKYLLIAHLKLFREMVYQCKPHVWSEARVYANGKQLISSMYVEICHSYGSINKKKTSRTNRNMLFAFHRNIFQLFLPKQFVTVCVCFCVYVC